MSKITTKAAQVFPDGQEKLNLNRDLRDAFALVPTEINEAIAPALYRDSDSTVADLTGGPSVTEYARGQEAHTTGWGGFPRLMVDTILSALRGTLNHFVADKPFTAEFPKGALFGGAGDAQIGLGPDGLKLMPKRTQSRQPQQGDVFADGAGYLRLADPSGAIIGTTPPPFPRIRSNNVMRFIPRAEADEYYTRERLWQGLPGIEVTGGRIWVAFYANTEQAQEIAPTFCVLKYSDDQGATWVEYGYIDFTDRDNGRLFDPRLWMDPTGALWMFVGCSADTTLHNRSRAAWAICCHNPQSDFPAWGRGIEIAPYGVPGKPEKFGEKWMLCIDYWNNIGAREDEAEATASIYEWDYLRRSATKLCDVPRQANGEFSTYDESSAVPLVDGRIRHIRRTEDGLYTTVSGIEGPRDNWSEPVKYEALGNSPDSRAAMRVTPSGRIVIVYNNAQYRNNMSVVLSSDGGQTFTPPLSLLAETNVSYPDIAFDDAGNIYAAFDRGRTSQRQVFVAIVNEADLIAGTATPTLLIADQQGAA